MVKRSASIVFHLCMVLSLSFGISGAVRAQTAPTTADTPKPHKKPAQSSSRLGLQLGTFTPAANTLTSTDSSWMLFQLNYGLEPTRSKKVFQPSVFFEIAGNKGNKTFDDRNLSIHSGRMFQGIGLSENTHLNFLNKSLSLIGGIGGGLFALQSVRHYSYHSYSTIPSTGVDLDYLGTVYPGDGSSTQDHIDRFGLRPGFQLFGGLKHKNGAYLEFGWYDAGKMGGLYYRGTSIAVGYRL